MELLELVYGHCLHLSVDTFLSVTDLQTGLLSTAGAFGSGEK